MRAGAALHRPPRRAPMNRFDIVQLGNGCARASSSSARDFEIARLHRVLPRSSCLEDLIGSRAMSQQSLHAVRVTIASGPREFAPHQSDAAAFV